MILAGLPLFVLGTGAPPESTTQGEAAPVVVAVERDQATNVVVTVEGCGDLDAIEVARVLDLELRSVTTEIRTGPALSVRLTCRADRLSITVEDPITQKQLARDVPAPPREPGRERIVALAVSELFNASWLELLTTPVPPPSERAPATAPPPPPPAVTAAKKLAETRTRPRRGLELLVGAGVRGRSLESGEPFAAVHVDGSVRGWLGDALGLSARVGWDFGQSTRELGSVRGHAITAAGGLSWRVRPRPVIGVGGEVLVGVAWARLSGIGSEPGIATGHTSGASGEVTASVGPRIAYGRLRLDLDGEVGVMPRSPRGVVDDGPDVTMGGVWVGLTLRLGADVWGTPRRPGR